MKRSIQLEGSPCKYCKCVHDSDEEAQIVTEACPECQPVPKEVFKDFQLPRVSNRFPHCFDHQLEDVLKWYATSPGSDPPPFSRRTRRPWLCDVHMEGWRGDGRVSSAFNFYAEEEIAARASKPEVIFKASDVDNYTNEGIHPPCDRLYCEVRNFSKKLFCVVSNRTKCITFDMRESNGAYINHMHDHFCTVLLVLQDVAPELRHITVRGGFMSVRAILETVEWINTLELEDVYVYGFRHLIPGYVHSDMSYLECGWMRTEKSYLKLNALFARGANQPHHVIHVAEELLDTFHLTSKDPLPI
ncbi:uncharacterized protein LOC129596490 [Paramacrobiotus metropolitanus]|uniref:uncharacterized protein LOC129596490 n=1 Tax=Paramacrobiotus metropolitanus TaxID=2943436 RepID=UPI0024461DD6|nr:uncharacterized protein LOC129596490 [Paramacrobiotus metropolitanus]